MLSQVQPVYQYYVDASDVIVSVDEWWLAFAKENNATELDETYVVGRQAREFIADEPTRSLYKEINAYVRMHDASVTVPFRCDSPTLERYMQLTISKCANHLLLYESVLVRTVPQSRLRILDSSLKRSNAFLTMCSFCKRSLIEPAGWLDLQDISLKLRLFEKQTVPGLRYTVCPKCVSNVPPELRQQQPLSL